MLEDNFSKSVLIVVFILMISAVFYASFSVGANEVRDRRTFSSTQSEDELLFGTYNNNYEPKVTNEKDGRLVVLNIDAKSDNGKGNKALVNYISNVGGKLLSVNGVDVEGSDGTMMPITIPGTSFAGVINTGEEVDEKRNVFVILVPKDAPAVDNLEERIELYARYAK